MPIPTGCDVPRTGRGRAARAGIAMPLQPSDNPVRIFLVFQTIRPPDRQIDEIIKIPFA